MTGFTYELLEEDLSFPEFTMRCARAFGALYEMRDSPMDSPIPSSFQPHSYYLEKIKRLTDDLASLEAMSQAEAEEYGKEKISKELVYLNKEKARYQKENAKLSDMLVQIESWKPPTEQHEGLKQFMYQQVKDSLPSFDYIEGRIKEAKNIDPISMYKAEVDGLQESIKRHQKYHKEECVQAKEKTEWIQQLRESLGVKNV